MDFGCLMNQEAALEGPLAAFQWEVSEGWGIQRPGTSSPAPKPPPPAAHPAGDTPGLLPTDMSLLYSSRRCLLEAMKSPPFSTQPVCSPVSAGRSRLTTSRVCASSSTSTSLGRSCHRRPAGDTHRVARTLCHLSITRACPVSPCGARAPSRGYAGKLQKHRFLSSSGVK